MEAQKMFVEKNNMEIVTLGEIRLVGLSFQKLGWTNKCGKYPQMWGLFNDQYRADVKNLVQPFTAYWFWYNEPNNAEGYSYFIGGHVTDFEDVDDALVTFTIPARKYIKHSFNADDFGKLVDDVLSTSQEKTIKWAEENGHKVIHMPVSSTQAIQVYPEHELEAKYPSMYTLMPVE